MDRKTAYIVSPSDGRALGTKLFSPSGEEIPCVVSFDIDKIDPETHMILATIVLAVSLGKET